MVGFLKSVNGNVIAQIEGEWFLVELSAVVVTMSRAKSCLLLLWIELICVLSNYFVRHQVDIL